MYFPEPVYDAESDLDVTTVGCHHLNGFHALQVVRARHLVHKGPGVTSNNPADWTPEAQSLSLIHIYPARDGQDTHTYRADSAPGRGRAVEGN